MLRQSWLKVIEDGSFRRTWWNKSTGRPRLEATAPWRTTFLCGLRKICAHWSRRMCRARWTIEQICCQGTTSPQGNGRSTRSRFRKVFGRARVDFFASEDNSHCPIFFTKSPRLAQSSALCFPSNRFATAGTQASQGATAQTYSNSPPLEEPAVGVIPAVRSSPWPIPLRRDLLSQANGTLWHQQPELWALHVWLLNASLFGFPERVLNTMAEARAPSTRCLCALKWSVFSTWHPRLGSGHFRCVSGSLISAGDVG